MILKNIYLIGLGAIGGAYGSKFLENGVEGFRVIADRERIKRYKGEGILINGKKHEFTYISPDDGAPKGDLIFVACKYHQLREVTGLINNFVNDKTIIISLLNGITSEEIIGSRLGMDKMLYAICLGIDAQRNGNEIKYKNIGRIIFGERHNHEISTRVREVAELLKAASIPYEIPDDAMKALWKKFMINAGINQTSAVLGANYGIYQNDENARSLMTDTMKEVIGLSQKTGINLQNADIDMFLELMKGFDPEGKTSMLQDMEAGRITEVDMLAGVIVELGRKYDFPTPLNTMLLKMIKTMESMKRRIC